MKELVKSFLGITLVVAVSFLIGCRYGRKTARIEPETKIIRDTVSCTIYDTVVFERPVYRVSYVTDTVATYFTTIEHDTVLVNVPIERKVYEEDSLYHAVVSGWRPSLDTLIVWPKTTTITIREQVKTPAPRLSFGITAGPSALVTPNGKVYGGIGASFGLTYNF
jgi:hypothetical protein